MINLILDILIYNYTNYLSFFFLVDLNKRKLLVNVGIALIIDYILNMYIYNLIFLLVIYLITKLIKINMHNLLNYYLYNISIILIYYIFSNIIFNYITILNFLNVLIINSIFILISYKIDNKFITLSR